MGSYIKVIFPVYNESVRDLLIADLINFGFDSIEETSESVITYIPKEDYDERIFKDVTTNFTIEEIPDQNWNAVWEESFEPVIVPGFCTIRADFHQIALTTPYEVVITPKMSFGTGHHATTQLMAIQMQQTGFAGKTILDFGTGTGILAILAEKLGAARVIAIDNDVWSYENALENIQRNGCQKIEVRKTTINTIGNQVFDFILANINRHILLENMEIMHQYLAVGGTIIMSGLLISDRDIVEKTAMTADFKFMDYKELNGWICLVFEKPKR